MEGCPTAVTTTLTLPGQPAAGTVEYVPLGGDGFYSPIAAYSLANIGATGAVGGGALTVRVNMDTRYCSLISYVSIGLVQATPADVEVRFTIADTKARVPRLVEQGDVTFVDSDISVATIAKTWNPPATVLPGGTIAPFVQLVVVNIDADIMNLDALIYLFNVRARELTPMGPLLWARGST